MYMQFKHAYTYGFLQMQYIYLSFFLIEKQCSHCFYIFKTGFASRKLLYCCYILKKDVHCSTVSIKMPTLCYVLQHFSNLLDTRMKKDVFGKNRGE